jgi:hypothetical protein
MSMCNILIWGALVTSLANLIAEITGKFTALCITSVIDTNFKFEEVTDPSEKKVLGLLPLLILRLSYEYVRNVWLHFNFRHLLLLLVSGNLQRN